MIHIMRQVENPTLRDEILNLRDDYLVMLWNLYCEENQLNEQRIYENHAHKVFWEFGTRRDVAEAVFLSKDTYTIYDKWYTIDWNDRYGVTYLNSFSDRETILEIVEVDEVEFWLIESENKINEVLRNEFS